MCLCEKKEMRKPTLNDCTLIRLPRFTDERGTLTFLEGKNHIPFDIKRVVDMYDFQIGQPRGAHAHKELHQLLICISGSFDVCLDDGSEKRVVRLDKPWEALHIPPLIWASESNFSFGAV